MEILRKMKVYTDKEIKYRDKLTGSDEYDYDGYYKFPFYEEDLWISSEE